MTGPTPPLSPRPRRLDRASLAAAVIVLLLVPVTLTALHILWSVATIWWPGLPLWAVTAGWTGTGTLLFTRPGQRLIIARRLGLRPPTADEQARLDHAWQTVARRARINPDDYLLHIQDSSDINAAAAGGHLIAVTSRAIHQLPDRQLEAVLAHELGHHLGLHPALLLIRVWLTLPLLAVARLAAVFAHAAATVNLTALLMRAWLVSLAAAIVVWVLVAAASLFRLTVGLVGLLESAARRVGEHRADAIAVDLGYGAALAQALNRYHQPDRPRWIQRLTSDHPPMPHRIARIRHRVARPGHVDGLVRTGRFPASETTGSTTPTAYPWDVAGGVRG